MDVTLSNISTFRLIQSNQSRSDFDAECKEIFEWLTNNQITDYQMLSEKLLGHNPGLSSKACRKLTNQLNSLVKKVNCANQNGQFSQTSIFTFETYQRAQIDIETARITDECVKGTALIYKSPTYAYDGGTEAGLSMHSVAQVKHFLEHLTPPELKNGISIINPALKPSGINKIAGAINFYDQQVVRQILETGKQGVEVFNLNYDERYQLVKEQLPRIIDYILAESEVESVWCSMTNCQRERLRQLGHSTGEIGFNNPTKWLELLNGIIHYVTLGELENDICCEQLIPIVTENGIEYITDIPAKRFCRSLLKDIRKCKKHG